jgi:glycosyltransferase involved in cell wall biosynthesis
MDHSGSGGVLVISEVRGDTRRYRALHLVEQLRLAGLPCTFSHAADPGLWQAVERPWHSAVLHRLAYGRQVERLCARLRANRALILCDFDDLIFDLSAFPFIDSPDFADPIRVAYYRQTMRNHLRTLEQSSGALVSTDFLAGRVRQVGRPAWVHRNAFSLEMLAVSEAARARKRPAGRVTIGYASGTPTHNLDFERIKPALIEILRRYPQVDLCLVGPLDPGPGWAGLEARVLRRPFVHWRKLPAILAAFDVNLAPLATDNPFAQSKSEIKFMEAALVETPSVASPTEAFQHAICPGRTGFLAEGPEQWQVALAALVEDPGLRAEIGKRAHAQVLQEYHPRVRAAQLVQTLDELSREIRGAPFPTDADGQAAGEEPAKRPPGGPWLPAEYEREASLFSMGLYSLRNLGLGALLKRVWIFLRRAAAPVFPYRRPKKA